MFGAGRFGRALARALKHAGVPVMALGIRQGARPSALQRAVGVKLASGAAGFVRALPAPTLVFICVQDRNVAQAAAELASVPSAPIHRFAHSCATLGPSALDPLAQQGARVGTFHLLQSFGPSPFAWQRVAGSFCAIEASGGLRRELFERARALGARPFDIRGPQRAAYHAAAVLASNALYTLLDAGERVLLGAGFARRAAAEMLVPLMQGSLANALALGAAEALTGPVVRGDTETVSRHLTALLGRERELYRVLMQATLELALRTGRLSQSHAAPLEKLLRS